MIDSLVLPLEPVAFWILFASCKSIAVIAAVFLCRRLFGHWLSAQGRYGLWFAVIACLTVPFGAQVNIGMLRGPSIAATESHIDDLALAKQTRHEEPTISIGDPARSESSSNSAASIRSWLIVVWLSVALGLMVVVLRNLVRYLRIKANANEVDVATRRLFEQCKSELDMRRNVRLLETSQVESPAVFGWRLPTLLLPLDLSKQLTSGQLRLVFLHELSHVQRHDVLVNWLVAIVQIAHWFNPFVWYALRVMRADMEQACDAKVINRMSEREQVAYGNTLIRLSDFQPGRMLLPQGAGIVESHSQLKARLNMIAQFAPKSIKQSLLAVVTLMTVTSVAITQPRSDSVAAIEAADAGLPSTSLPSPVAPIGIAAADLPTASRPMEKESSQTKNAAKEATRARAPANAPQSVEPLQTEYLHPTYVGAADLARHMNADSGLLILSERGRVIADERTNTLVIRDTVERIADVKKLVATLDTPELRALIDVRIAIVNDDFSREVHAKAVPLQNSGYGSPTLGPLPVNTPPFQRRSSLAGIAVFAQDFSIDAELLAAESTGRGEIISAPRVVVANRKQATISQGLEIPYFTDASGNGGTDTARAAVKFMREMLSLKITPHITSGNRISIDIEVIKERTDPAIPSDGAVDLITNKRKIVTQMLVDDGRTMSLGGLLEMESGDKNEPSTTAAKSKRELLIFLTPTISRQEPGYVRSNL